MEWPITLAAITLVTLLILSVPIGVAIGSSVVVAVMVGDLPAEFLMQKLVLSLDSFPLLAVPFFVLSGEIMQKGSMAQSLLAFSKCLVGHIRGGLAHVSILHEHVLRRAERFRARYRSRSGRHHDPSDGEGGLQ